MKTLALLLFVGLVIPLQHAVIGQQARAPRIANDWCYPGVTDNGWETMCAVQIFESSGETFVAGHSPAWSPDGLRIAYLYGNLYVYDRTTDTSVSLTDALPLSGPLSWSRDGAHLAVLGWFEGSSGWTQELLVIDPDGSNLTRLTHGVGFSGTYAWSPSGNAIAFGRDDGGIQELYVMGADGSNQRRLTYRVGFGGAISWSPDGGRIAFDCGTTICAIDLDGTNHVQLAPAAANASTAIFSPVGGNIAFLTGWSGYGDLQVMRPDGSIVGVAPGVTATKPRWSPDGRSLAFVQEAVSWGGACNADGSPCVPPDETYVVEGDGTGLRMLAFGSNPAWFVPLPGQPAAAFTTECTGSTCQFSAAGSFDPDGTIVSYEWKFGDGTTGSGPAPAHTYSSGNTYGAILIVTDGDGKRDAARGVVRANAVPVASFSMACTGPTCIFDGSASVDSDGTVTQYTWNFGDGSFDVGDPAHAVVTHTYPTGTFTATLYVTDEGGASSATTSQTVTVANARPVASFTVSCSGLTCAYDASASSDPDGSLSWVSWNFGDGSTGSGLAGTYRYFAGGTYTITLTVADHANQTSTASRTVTVVAPPPPTMHVGDLDGSSTTVKNSWYPYVTIAFHTENHGSVAGVGVSGVWDDGSPSTCTTDESGRCSVSRAGVPRKISSASFTVTGANRSSFVFSPGANHDPDGDSNGTTVVIRRQ